MKSKQNDNFKYINSQLISTLELIEIKDQTFFY